MHHDNKMPVLPQFASAVEQKQREFELSLARTAYNYMFSYLDPLPISADVPEGESFTLDYNAQLLKVFLPLADNFKAVIVALLESELLNDLPQEGLALLHDIETTFAKFEADKEHHKYIKEGKDIVHLMGLLAQVPKTLVPSVKGISRLPKDVVTIITGLEKVFAEFEREGFTAFLKNTLFDMLTIDGKRNYLQASSLGDYQDLYKKTAKPFNLSIPIKPWMTVTDELKISEQDWYFGYMQIGGFNTTNLKGVVSEPLTPSSTNNAVSLLKLLEKFPITDEVLQSVTGQKELTLQAAAQAGTLYVCDYSMFDGLKGSEIHNLKRYVTAPIALFYWNETPPQGYPPQASLQPIAIQLGQQYDAETMPIFTPNDCTNNNDPDRTKWQVAKLSVQNACAIQHETVAHLGACHLTIEPMVIAANRQLSQQHPIMVLLKPHFRFTLDINNGAIHSLIVPGGVVDSLVGTDHSSSCQLIVDAYNHWRFDEQFPDVLFTIRGVEKDRLAEFPFRDDTLLLWQAIQSFVESYLSLYYQGDTVSKQQKMLADKELQSWINEMVNSRRAAVKGMNGLSDSVDGSKQIDDFDYLVKVISLIIYTASAQHASVNYAQYPLMTYIPSVTGALYAPPPNRSQTLSQTDFIKWLPPLDVSLYQVSFGYLLSSVQYDILGYYNQHHRYHYFADERVEPLLAKFQLTLKQIEVEITERNRQRPLAYKSQLPSMIPNSISI
ncbi:MAG: arachidonate 15-lipoxygenase [Kangiellaceae bacterium]|nr:arachidonate 15-lipoxygenase [Kangiellaceae bacterium]